MGESYPFAPGGRLLLAFDNHNSVNGIREFARAKGAGVDYAPLTVPDLRLDRARLEDLLAGAADPRAPRKLFAYPAQSNFSGVQHPLELVDVAHGPRLGRAAGRGGVRADQSARPARCPAGLRVASRSTRCSGIPPAWAVCSSGNAALAVLTPSLVCGRHGELRHRAGRVHVLSPHEAGFEDGTLNYLGIPAVEIGLRHLERIGIETIGTRVRLPDGLAARSACSSCVTATAGTWCGSTGPTTTDARGGTVTMNFYDPDGHLLDYRRIEELAGARGISLRTGCFCNPGAGEIAEGLTESDMRAGLEAGDDMTLPRFLQVMQHRGGKSAGAIRVSLGLVSNFADVEAFVAFASGFRDATHLAIGQVTFDIESCRVIRDGA